MKEIPFYRLDDPYGCFSNFSHHPMWLKEKSWPTAEHYFQAQKFPGTDYEEKIRLADSPMIAKNLGQTRKVTLRSDWETVKDEIMIEALRAKFTQHQDIRAILLSTEDAVLIEHTTNDRYWADGGDGSGKNMLGKLLMQVREELKSL